MIDQDYTFRQLEWEDNGGLGLWSNGLYGHYRIVGNQLSFDPIFGAFHIDLMLSNHDSLESCKEAAQKHYEGMIKEHLTKTENNG